MGMNIKSQYLLKLDWGNIQQFTGNLLKFINSKIMLKNIIQIQT